MSTKARLDHGITTRDPEFDRRLRLHWKLADPYTEIAVMPPFTKDDLSYVPFLEPDPRDSRRRVATSAHLASQHEDRHFFYHHPFCYLCRGGDELMAARSMDRWMAMNPGKPIPEGSEVVPATGGEPPELRAVETWPGVPFLPQVHFEVVEPDGGASAFMSMDDLEALEEPVMMVDGILPIGGHGIISGRDQSYKTFLAIDLMMHVVTMRPWHDRPVEIDGYGRVLFLAGEGARSFGARLAAWQEQNGALQPHQRGNVTVRNGAVVLSRESDALRGLEDHIRETKPDLIVFDTLQRHAGALDQNSASDMAVITERITALRALAGPHCTSIMVAHTNKGDADVRGSSSIEDDADFVLKCKRGGENKLTLTVQKEKDCEDGYDIPLAVKVVGPSLVIVDPKATPPVVWSSSSLDNRICGALRSVASLDPLSKAEIVRMVHGDGHPKEGASQTAIYAMVNTLVNEGRVIAVPVSKTSTKYQINPEWKPSTDIDPLEV